jgi:hypothetical protein
MTCRSTDAAIPAKKRGEREVGTSPAVAEVIPEVQSGAAGHARTALLAERVLPSWAEAVEAGFIASRAAAYGNDDDHLK